jgi:hypothetical protein
MLALSSGWHYRLLNLKTHCGTNVIINCSDGKYEQLFFKYFPIHILVFEDIVWGSDIQNSLQNQSSLFS